MNAGLRARGAREADCGRMVNMLRRLDAGAKRRLRTTLARASRRKLRSAMRHFALFAEAIPTRELFTRDPLHNEWTMCLYLEYAAIVPSPRTGNPIAVASAAGYASMLVAHWSREQGFALLGQAAQRLPGILRQMRRKEPVRVRRGRRGLRRKHLETAWDASATLRGTTADAVNKIAAVSTAWQAVARGAEVAPDRFSAARHPTRADLLHSKPGKEQPAYTVWLTPLKKKVAMKVPIMFAKGDGGASDTYAMLARLEKYDPVPRGKRSETPLFRLKGKCMNGKDFTKAVQDVAEAAGQPRKKFTKHSPRVGAASDLGDMNASPLLLQAKGRWAGDLGKIYSRMTRRKQLAVSKGMVRKRTGRDMEELFPGFVQPV